MSLGGTSRKSTWMVVNFSGDTHPPALSMTLHCIVVPGGAASKTICREPCPAVITPPVSVQLHVEPGWLTALAEAPDAPTGTEMGAVMTGRPGVTLTVTVAVDVLVDAQPLAPMTVSE